MDYIDSFGKPCLSNWLWCSFSLPLKFSRTANILSPTKGSVAFPFSFESQLKKVWVKSTFPFDFHTILISSLGSGADFVRQLPSAHDFCAGCSDFNKSKDAGLTFVKYYGDVIPTTRQICRNIVNGVIKSKRRDGLFTIDEIRQIWSSRSWSGKKAGDPLVVRGGYNCRHQWSYVNPDWYDSSGELII